MFESCNYINSEWVVPVGGAIVEIKNPADNVIPIFTTIYAEDYQVLNAVETAVSSWKAWKKKSFDERAILVEEWLNNIEKNRDNIANTITIENGKLLCESQSEISACLNEGRYQLQFLSENLTESVNGNEIRYEAIGPVLLITPWNFPVATILRKLLPALLTGNTAVVKASEFTPYSSAILFRLFGKINFPPGVVSLITGPGDKLVPKLIKSGKFSAVSFTGSVVNGQAIAQQINYITTRYQAELGGNNTVMVLNDADLLSAANSIISNGFACCGQWCTGTGRVIVDESVHAELISLLIERAEKIICGNGLDANVTLGPVINERQLGRIELAVKQAKDEGAKILMGGKKLENLELINGNFFEPTIIDNVTATMTVSDIEIFGPVLMIMKTKNIEEMIRIMDKSNYGLTFSVYTQDNEKANYIIENVDSGLCHINLPTAVRDVALPLLGWKNSGIGLPESGRFMRDFFTKTKSVYR